MSGINVSAQNKFNSCEGCPDRTVEPNCHMSCEGYTFRKNRIEKFTQVKKEQQTIDNYEMSQIIKRSKRIKR